ncbi:MAG TPA: endonuclease/exonuclease/phosphatase family protein [Gaiellales bacterium]|nr:endonuclease/exonuclease/phosphatase family protein [Gaiellales bacterium]
MPKSLLIRTWNIAHGRDVPPGPDHAHVRRKLLREMARVMVEDEPDIVLLQEVPVWAADLLREHTGMGVTLAASYGAHIPFVHVPLPLPVGAAVGRALPDLVRTQVEGQAQAILYGPALLLVSARRVQLNERTRLRGEPRIAQLARLRHRRAGRELVVANVHADPGGDKQVEKAGFVLERFARGAPMVLAGDLNLGTESGGVRALRARGFVEESGEVGIDHVLVRGFELDWAATRWLPERRDLRRNGSRPVRLSDHDPVDAVVSFA